MLDDHEGEHFCFEVRIPEGHKFTTIYVAQKLMLNPSPKTMPVKDIAAGISVNSDVDHDTALCNIKDKDSTTGKIT
jgi:hypothetical protein